MRIKTSMTIAFLIGLNGCAAGIKPITTPTGKQGYLVSCDGSAGDWSTCYEASIKVCGGPYTVVDRNETSTPTVYGPLVRRHMIAECNREPGTASAAK